MGRLERIVLSLLVVLVLAEGTAVGLLWIQTQERSQRIERKAESAQGDVESLSLRFNRAEDRFASLELEIEAVRKLASERPPIRLVEDYSLSSRLSSLEGKVSSLERQVASLRRCVNDFVDRYNRHRHEESGMFGPYVVGTASECIRLF